MIPSDQPNESTSLGAGETGSGDIATSLPCMMAPWALRSSPKAIIYWTAFCSFRSHHHPLLGAIKGHRRRFLSLHYVLLVEVSVLKKRPYVEDRVVVHAEPTIITGGFNIILHWRRSRIQTTLQ